MTVLYGIANCDTVRKARKWLESHDIDFRFHDFRKDGLSEAQVQHWISALGVPALLNKRSATWKQLSEEEKKGAEAGDIALFQSHPTLIKRPVLETADGVLSGFVEDRYRQALKV